MTENTELDQQLLDYNQTSDLIRTLTDVRFKLLALAPTVTGTAVALLSHAHATAELLGVGSLGLVATVGLVVYELRNTQLHEYALLRARTLERRLGLGSLTDQHQPGGLYSDQPLADLRVLGLLTATPEHGLALVYGAVTGGWSYLVAWGALHAAGAGSAQTIGGLIGATTALLLVAGFLRTAPHTGLPKQSKPSPTSEPRAPLTDV
jgi:hypothetical protein